jgi:hypothetical protein
MDPASIVFGKTNVADWTAALGSLLIKSESGIGQQLDIRAARPILGR